MAGKKWTIAPLVLATAVRNISQMLLMARQGASVDTAVLGWLIRSGEQAVLVDTGFGSMEKEDLKGEFKRTPEQTVEAQLKRFALKPEEVELVINTHLHLDHCAGNCYVPNARFVVQRSELQYALDPLPAHKQAYDVDLPLMNLDLLDGDSEIADGIRVITTPGHSPGSQAVLVDTESGLFVMAGDTIAHYVNMEVPKGASFWPGPLYVDLREYYQSLDRLRDLGGTILPGHDSLVLKQIVYP
jgi:N-acyl homoserine lactone hydrolase